MCQACPSPTESHLWAPLKFRDLPQEFDPFSAALLLVLSGMTCDGAGLSDISPCAPPPPPLTLPTHVPFPGTDSSWTRTMPMELAAGTPVPSTALEPCSKAKPLKCPGFRELIPEW